MQHSPSEFLALVRRSLWPSWYRSRFEKELLAHIEDAGGTDSLGSPEQIAAFFNKQTGARRKMLIALFVCLFTFWCTFWTVQFLGIDETPMEQWIMDTWVGKLYGPFALIGLILHIPLIFLNPLLIPLFGGTWILPFTTSFIYTSLYVMWNFPPPRWKWRAHRRPPTASI